MRARVAEIMRRLGEAYGVPAWRPHHDATSELVLTILSQNTSDANSGRAFARLLERYGTWEEVVEAPVADVVAAIQPGGLAPTKAPRIQGALAAIREARGGFDLEFLRGLPPEEARAWLAGLHGVGPKTASCVLLFALGMPAMPVDTHVFRVAMRLGLIAERTAAAGRRSARGARADGGANRHGSDGRQKRRGKDEDAKEDRTAAMTAAKAHALLEAIVPAEDYYAFHISLIKHGRRTCTAQRPQCPSCVLLDLCPSARLFHPEVAAR